MVEFARLPIRRGIPYERHTQPMGVFDNIKSKAEDLVGKDKVAKAEDFAKQNAEKIEEVTDKGLDAAAGAADKVTGGKFSDKIKSARDSADQAIDPNKGQ